MQSSLPLCAGLTLKGQETSGEMSWYCCCYSVNRARMLSPQPQPFRKWLSPISSLPYLSPDAHANENRLISASHFVWGKASKPHEWHSQTGILSAHQVPVRQRARRSKGAATPGTQNRFSLSLSSCKFCLQSKDLLSSLCLVPGISWQQICLMRSPFPCYRSSCG